MDKTILWYPKYLLDSLKMEHSTDVDKIVSFAKNISNVECYTASQFSILETFINIVMTHGENPHLHQKEPGKSIPLHHT